MKGRLFIYHGIDQRVINCKRIGNIIHIVTDKNWYEIEVDAAEKILKEEFLAIDEPKEISGEVVMPIYNSIQETNLAEMLISNINTIKKDAGYINQAKAISMTVKTLIDAAKLEIEIKKFDRKSK